MMKKYISILSVFLIFAACSTKHTNNEDTNTKDSLINVESEQLENKEIMIDEEPALVGEITEADLKQPNYNTWYSFFKDDYKLNKEVINSFKDDIKNYDIKLFMGTWCSDSHEKAPAFIKIIEEANYPMEKIQIYSLDRAKKGLNGEEASFGISHVPTFIFLKNGQEVGRIVEAPINSLEEDIRDIIEGNPQTPNYAE